MHWREIVIIPRLFKHADQHRGRTLKSVRAALFACIAGGLGVGACAATPTYNPDGLDGAQLARVADVCQNVMGLSPSERLTGGTWIGAENLDYWTSHYRGCVLSLSDSVRGVADERATNAAHDGCVAQGLKPGSPELALCVLGAAKRQSPSVAERLDAGFATPVSAQLPPVSKSFYSASPHETARRERVACAALGLEPTNGTFASCVRELDGTLYSIDHPAE
jgi:hypothetical protein